MSSQVDPAVEFGGVLYRFEMVTVTHVRSGPCFGQSQLQLHIEMGDVHVTAVLDMARAGDLSRKIAEWLHREVHRETIFAREKRERGEA